MMTYRHCHPGTHLQFFSLKNSASFEALTVLLAGRLFWFVGQIVWLSGEAVVFLGELPASRRHKWRGPALTGRR